jgi:SAM-dependent methyltransferase
MPVFVLLFGSSPCAGEETAPDPGVPHATVERIQRECLRAYPPELLAPMASGAKEIPTEVDADPEEQMDFLDKEIPLDKGLFYPSLLEDVQPAFERHLGTGTRFLDLGSGDGRILFLANLLGAHATGIEYDAQLVEISRKALTALDDLVDGQRVEIVQGDFFEETWSGYDVVYYFDLSSFEAERIREKLLKDLDPGALLLVNYEQEAFPGFEVVEVVKPVKVYRKSGGPAIR